MSRSPYAGGTVACVLAVACASSSPTSERAPAAAPAAVPVALMWDIDVARDWTMTERVCWGGARMAFVMPELASALPYATAVDDRGRALPVGPRGVDVAGARCATVTVDLLRAARELDDDDAVEVRGDAIVGSPDAWLWRPEPWPADVKGSLALTLPAGVSAVVPWPRGEDGRYAVSPTTWHLMCRCAFGAIATETLDVGDATFTLGRLPGALRATDAGLTRWLTAAAGAVSLVSGRFPVRTAEILVVPVDGGDAVPFGMAIRGGGPTAMMLVSADARDGDLLGEWVGVHELSHLLIPPVDREDAWLSEGLASYYQQILRGRAGLLTQAAAWGGLVDGFDRGKAGARDRPLSTSSARMFTDFGFVPVYWGGAAVMLKLDVALRQRGRSLDQVVAAVRVREPADVGYRSAADVVGWMADAAPDVDVRAIVKAALAESFPDVEPTLAALGVKRARGGTVVFVDDAPLAAVRAALMSR